MPGQILFFEVKMETSKLKEYVSKYDDIEKIPEKEWKKFTFNDKVILSYLYNTIELD